MKKYITNLVVALATVGLVSASANATTVNGTAGSFGYSLDDATSWGVPSVVGANNNTLLFNGAQFNVSSTGSTIGGDSVEITVNSFPGLAVGEIRVTAFGSYNLNGAGSSVAFQLSFDVEDLDMGGLVSQPVATTPVTFPQIAGVNAPLTVNGATYTAINDLDISNSLGFFGENVKIDLTAFTEALGGNEGGTSSLQVNVTALQLQFNFVPEPGTVCLLAIGGIALLRRRR